MQGLEALGTAVGRPDQEVEQVIRLGGKLEAEREASGAGAVECVGLTRRPGATVPRWVGPSPFWRVSERPGPLNSSRTCLTGTGRTCYSRAQAPGPGHLHGEGLSFLSLQPGPSRHPGRWGQDCTTCLGVVLASGFSVS